MKQLRTQNLGINFLSRDALKAMGKSDPSKLWFVPCGFISESWVSDDDSTWYLKFSNGTAMQGGALTTSNVTVAFPLPFVDTSYSLTIGYTGLTSTTGTNKGYAQAGMKTATSFFIRARYNTTTYAEACDWMACGGGKPMKQLHTQNLGINFLSRNDLAGVGSLDPTKLWFVPAECVVEAWLSSDGLSWYRRFSSGIVLQGGTVPTTNALVTLPTPFANGNYTITLAHTQMATPDGGEWAYCQCGVKTPTSFWLRARLNSTNYSERCDWVAFGIGL
jgi:hypothetical protein